jgi:sugar lactone lactonase YvrE
MSPSYTRWLIVVGLCAASCSPSRTEILIGVATDLSAPDIIDRVQLSARREGVEVLRHDWDISGIPAQPFELPGSFGIYSTDGSEPTVQVDVRGFFGNQEIVRRTSILSLIREKTLFLRMGLVNRCMNRSDCPAGRTCVEGRCVPEQVESPTLPAYVDGMERTVTCNSGTTFINTGTNEPLEVVGTGQCGPGQRCLESTCYDIPTSCQDGVRNGTETDIDCGGSCGPCTGAAACQHNDDCATGICTGGVCRTPTCTDQAKNGSETDVDCGGGACPACPDNRSCQQGSDCTSGVCTTSVCRAPSCTDGVKNGLETDVDCGGGACPACPNNATCQVGGDCMSSTCISGVCTLPSCADGQRNGNETDVDCGGSCPACPGASACQANGDCRSGACLSGTCALQFAAEPLAGQLGGPGTADGVGIEARTRAPYGLAYDATRDALYFADTGNHTIRRVDLATGQVTTLAGLPGALGSADGMGSAARFDSPQTVAYDGAGLLFVADTNNHTIRQVAVATGVVTTLAGAAGMNGSADGTGPLARFSFPRGVAYDPAGALYIADTNNHTIRRVEIATGNVTTLAGTAGAFGGTDGTGTSALFNAPQALTYDGVGSLFVADTFNHTIRQVDVASAAVGTLAGTAGSAGSRDGTAGGALFNRPQGVAYDGRGTLFVTDTLNSTIRSVVVATGEVTTLAGAPGMLGSTDGIGAEARFSRPQGVCHDRSGNLFVADTMNHTLRRIVVATAAVTTLAGAATSIGSADGTGSAALFNQPQGVAHDGRDELFIADTQNHTLRRMIISTGAVTTLAGMAGVQGTTDGTGAAARFRSPQGLAYSAGTLFVADVINSTIRQVDVATGQVTTLAGTAGLSGSVDGTGAAARFNRPQAVAYDGVGILYVADTGNHTLRRIDVTKAQVTTLAGVAGQSGTSDGMSDVARFNRPQALAYAAGALYVADTTNHLIRRVDAATGEVTTLAGMAGKPGSADGTGTAAQFNGARGLVHDGSGSLYIVDTGNHTVRQLFLATGQVLTVLGRPGQAAVRIGPPSSTLLNSPVAIAVVAPGLFAIASDVENTLLLTRGQ